ncbi:helix-turn-helix domain-containing protein [Bradyrhizobium sp. DASA03068]|uniref:helix-turn-helix domain-containing protein n=1 Tax=Bradyrhizobium sp. BLXBL-01 TaxID=3395915 RepID=UPI003F6FAB8E
MNGEDFQAWRESFGLTQTVLADRVKVSRTTIQSWENMEGELPQAAANIRHIWDRRLKQESALHGPLTLVYATAPMFVDAYRPHAQRAVMIQEPHPNNAAVLARVQQLSGRVDFHTPFVLENERQDVWNAVELDRVSKGDDHQAPTLQNLLFTISQDVREGAKFYVRAGTKTHTPAQKLAQEGKIHALAEELFQLSSRGLAHIVDSGLRIEEIFKELLMLGTKAPDDLVSAVAFALTALEQSPIPREEPRMESAGNYVIDYRGYEISYQSPPIFPNRWVINLSSTSPHLVNRLGQGNIILEDITLEGAVSKAKRYVDGLR